MRFLKSTLVLLSLLTSISASAVATGTGFAIGDGLTYVTNFHVVEGAKNICIRTSDGKLEKAVVASSNQEDDLVLLRSAVQRPPLQFAPPYDVAKGMTVLTIGYPSPKLLGLESKVTEGMVNSLSGYGGDRTLLQISVPIQPGNSGGPLLTEYGDVAGVVVAKLGKKYMDMTGDMPTNVGFAVHIARLRALLETTPKASVSLEISKRGNKIERTKMVEKAELSVVLVIADEKNGQCRKGGDIEPPPFGVTPSELAQKRKQVEMDMAKREREERAAIAERESRLIKEREQEEARRLEEERKEKAKKAEAERTEQQLNGIAQNWKEVFSSVGYKLWLEVTKGEEQKDGPSKLVSAADVELLREYKGFVLGKISSASELQPINILPVDVDRLLKLGLVKNCGYVDHVYTAGEYFTIQSSIGTFPRRFAAQVGNTWAIFTTQKVIGSRASAIGKSGKNLPERQSVVIAEECK